MIPPFRCSIFKEELEDLRDERGVKASLDCEVNSNSPASYHWVRTFNGSTEVIYR